LNIPSHALGLQNLPLATSTALACGPEAKSGPTSAEKL
jgi:hypothetical protein